MGCCFGKSEQAREEPLLDKNDKEEAEGGQSRELAPAESSKSEGKSDATAAPPPLSEKKSGSPSAKKKTGKTESKSPEKDKSPAKKDKEKSKEKETPKKSTGKDTKAKEKKEDSPTKKEKSPTASEAENKSPTTVIDKSLKIQGRGGELPKPKEGTSNLNLNGKPSTQVGTNGRSAATVTRLKRSNNCIEDCRMEIDLSSGKLS